MLQRALSLTLVMLVAGTVVFAHLGVKKSLPAKGARITTSPEAIQVWFNQEPEMEKSGLTLVGPQGPVTVGAVEAGAENSLRATVGAALAPGAYTIEWKTAGDDGHVLTGKIPFTMAATAAR
jgi:methionine-rich copper-binding protein CopC